MQNHTLFKTKMFEIDILFVTKTAENPYPLGPHIPIEPILKSNLRGVPNTVIQERT